LPLARIGKNWIQISFVNCFVIPNRRLLSRKTEFEFVRPYDLIPKYLPAVAEKAQEGRTFCEARQTVRKLHFTVIPAKAGIHNLSDIKPFWIPDRVGNDKKNSFRTVWQASNQSPLNFKNV